MDSLVLGGVKLLKCAKMCNTYLDINGLDFARWFYAELLDFPHVIANKLRISTYAHVNWWPNFTSLF